MLTTDTERVIRVDMFFTPIIDRRGIADTAKAVGLPTKNVRRWTDMDSIPADWWLKLSEVGIATLDELAQAAEARRVSRLDTEAAA